MKTPNVKMVRTVLKGFFSAFALVLFLVNPALGLTVTITPTVSSTVTTQWAVPLPVGSVGTSFTGYSGVAVPYVTGTFYVGTSGAYSAAVSGTGVTDNGIEILTGVFSPSASPAPTTPISSFLAAIQGNPTSTIPSVTLTAGTQYSYLLLVNTGYNGTATLTLSGPGCISLGANTCQSIPALTPGAMAVLAMLLVGIAAFMMMKRASAY